MSGADFAALLPDVARRLLGDPPRIGADEWRYGSRGSLAVHVGGAARGTWRDFEADRSGGVLALIEHVNGCDKAGALRYLVDARLIDPPAGADARPANRGKPWHNGGPRAGIAGRIGAEAACERSAAPCWYFATARIRRARPGAACAEIRADR